MSDRIIAAVILFILPVMTPGKLIKSNKLTDMKPSGSTVKRNIFSPQKLNVREALTPEKTRIAEIKEELKKEKEESENRIIATVFYEGFLLKDSRIYALLKLNGQYYISGVGDILPGSILIKEILENKITLEIESSEVSVMKKGETNVD